MTTRISNAEAKTIVEKLKADFDHCITVDNSSDFEIYELPLRALAIQDRVAAIAVMYIFDYIIDNDLTETVLAELYDVDNDFDAYQLMSQLSSSVSDALAYS